MTAIQPKTEISDAVADMRDGRNIRGIIEFD